MGYIAKLTKGTTYIDLHAGRYTLAEDFVPPTTVIAPQITTGGIKTGETALPRDWGFGVRVWGTSSAEVKRGVDDLANFLKRAGDEAEPMYFEWREDSNVSAEPVWGQFGATRRMEVISGSLGYWESYATGTVMTRAVFVPVALTVKPWAQGSRQRLATATGGICEDWIGTTDGRSRGLIVAEGDATNGNKMTNPMFGHAAAWNTGWTAGADVTVSQNTNPEFVLFGGLSAKIIGDGGAADYYTQSIAAGGGAGDNHVLSCYAKMPDGGVISATQCALYYGANAATTYTAVGNGWYRLTAAVEGIVAATITGITVEQNYTIYADGFQLEQRDYATSFFYGDMLGCHWVTTAHASASHRVASKLSIPSNILEQKYGTLRFVWRANRSSTTYDAGAALGRAIALDGGSEILLIYNGTNWVFSSATAADTFSSGDVVIIHCTWNPATIYIYKDGSLSGSDTNVISTVGTTIYLGSETDGTQAIGGTIMGFAAYNSQMSTAEVLADYTNIAPLVADGQSIDPIPYLWTVGGDNFVHYEDSGNYCNVATVGGVAGDAPAKTEFKLGTAGLNAADIYIGSMDFDYKKYVDPEFLSYIPAAPPDVIDMTNVDITIATISVDDDEFELLNGRRIGVMLRADDTINNVVIKTGVNPGGAYYYTDQLATTWLVGSESNDMSPEIFVPPNEQLYRELGITRAMSVITVGKRLAAGATHYHLHSAQIVPYPLIRFVNTSASAFAVNLLYMGGKAYEVNSSALSYGYTVRGDQIELVPGRYNWLVSYLGKEGVVTDTSDIMEYQAVYITPRWLVA